MGIIKTCCDWCKEFFCLPTDLEEHEKYCPKRPDAPPKPMAVKKVMNPVGPPMHRHHDDDDGPGLGSAFIAGAVVGSMLGNDHESSHESEDSGSSFGDGDFGGGGSSGDFGDSGGGGDD